ncbi:hypothetical protein JOC95_001526 [Bacillus tianshenii]|uniref:Uncharacterized protein n=1 Tax=Sutcliffiella tianshenii TaxID=1463404 RepID=A0ABS2NYI3_9BACI|nr:hypothetical protein [Bacillus tianshenii]MBM7619674.1 hypothetical protein [Bacillus tianshenii]
MKFNQSLSLILLLVVVFCFSLPSKQFASWAYSFVVYEGDIYVISDEYVTEIDKEIGHVTKYSDKEGTYYGNFSNAYKKGTKYFSIKGVSTDTAIAVEDAGKYIKADWDGEYAGGKYNPIHLVIGGGLTIVILSLLILIVKKKVTSRNASFSKK